MKKVLDTIASLLVIVVAVLAIHSFLKRGYLNTSRLPVSSTLDQRIGQPFPANLNLSDHPKTIILALQVGCPYCAASAPFYRELDAVASAKNIGIIAIFPQTVETSNKYLAALGLPPFAIYSTSLLSVGVSATPTLVIVDHSGRILRVWQGQLSPEAQKSSPDSSVDCHSLG